MKLDLIPIEPENNTFRNNKEYIEIVEAFELTYAKVGYNPPWIGYFARTGDSLVGCGGFKGKPVEGKVEIAYGTFNGFENRGIGSLICRQILSLALQTDRNLVVTARSLINRSPSTKILEKTGFKLMGEVLDEDDGLVWEWQYFGNI